jgi:hypothetical protein
MGKSPSSVFISLVISLNTVCSYPSFYIEKQFRDFFLQFVTPSPFLPYVQQEKDYFLIRKNIMNQPTSRQSQVSNNAARAANNADETYEAPVPQPNTSIITTENTIKNDRDKLIIHYTHEKRFSSMKRDMHSTYDDVFQNTPAMDVKLIVGNRHRRTATNDLIRKRPMKALLKN